MHTKAKFGSLATALVLATFNVATAAELIPFGGSWAYFLGTQEASSPVGAWRLVGFDDSSWARGKAPIGYANPANDPLGWEASIATTLPSSANGNYLSVFFRSTFTIDNKADISQLSLHLHVDDGCIAWVNGVEVGRFGVPEGLLAYNTSAPEPTAEDQELSVSVNPNVLATGPNVIAIQVFQAGIANNDFLMDASVSSLLDADPPIVTVTTPVVGSTVRDLKFISVVFSEPVTNVDIADLLINDVPATNFVALSPVEYQFRFPQPPTGAVSVAWASGHQITDLASTPHPFAGGSWNYTLDPNAGPKTVVISEFLANNEHGLEDEDGTRSDWIELYNPGPLDVDLDGWYLSNTPTNLTVWRFPAVTLGATKYLLVWASEKNRTNALAPLHTNFKLAKDQGSYVGLVDPTLTVISYFTYPAQVPDISYGRDASDPSVVGPFLTATPGVQNPVTGLGFAGDPSFSLESGVYVYTNAPFQLAMTGPPGATIRYTTNGTLPTAASPIYTGPIAFSINMTIKARVFQPGLFPGRVISRNFILLDSTTREFSSNLPVLILSSEGRPITSDLAGGATNRTKGTFAVYDTFRGRASFARQPDLVVNAQFEGFGQTSAGWPKRPYNVEINDDVYNDLAVSVLGMPAEADWKLRNPWTDKCMMNDFLAFELFEQMGHYSERRQLVEVFKDETGGRVTYPADYYGVMLIVEKIERGKDRVNIAELTPSVTNEPAISGGYMFKKDKDSTGDLNFNTAGVPGSFSGQGLKLHEPKPREVNNNLKHPQMVWLTNYLARFEQSLYATNWLARTGTNHYSYYADLDSFADQFWIVEMPKQIDGYRLSSYFNKDRNGKIKPEPIWDWNLSFGNADYLEGGKTNGWYWALLADSDHIWARRMITGTASATSASGDPDFRQKVADRWGTLRTNVFSGERLTNRIDEVASLLTESAGRNYIKYTNLLLGVYHWPNPNGKAGGWDVDYVTPKTYAGIISEMKKWTYGRYLWIDGQFVHAPFMTLPAGPIQPGASLVMSGQGVVYYTLDGTDPRAAGGGVAPGALVASGPIVLNSNARVFARAYVSPTGLWSPWSPPSVATYVVSTPQLAITEIMYHPQAPTPPSAYIDEDFEYLEFKNVGQTTLDLAGYSVSGGIDFTFPSLQLAPNSRVLVVKNQNAFTSRYGNSATIAGQYSGNLANDGNRLTVWGRYREPIQDFVYDDKWYPITDGLGFSLVVVDEHASAANYGTAANWRPSGTINGSPGVDNGVQPTFPQVVINEALTRTDPATATDTIELANLGSTPANIGGWYLTDDFNKPKKFRIPTGRTIPANSQITFNESDFNVATPGNIPFALSAVGEEVYVFSADQAGNLTGYYHGYEFGAQSEGKTFGRYVNSIGEDHFVTLATPSLGAPNGPPAVGPVVISEIMYRPQEVAANGDYWNNTEHEYIELRNITPNTVNLYDPARPASRWKLDQAVEFTFPPETSIPGNGSIVVVSFNPNVDVDLVASFRSKYNINSSVPLVGPYKGNLDNSGDTISLYLPEVPQTNGTIPLVLVDRVHYRDSAPWPTDPDGMGQALQRKNLFAYGNDPTNWTAAGPSPGSDFVPGGNVPTITSQPSNAVASDSGVASATFTSSASGPGPLRYQWLFNGAVLPGATDSTLVLQNIKPSQAGSYQMVALNAYGSVVSAPAILTVLVAPKITQFPAPVVLRGSTNVADYGFTTNNATFTVAATGSGIIHFQWRYNGQNIPGATGPSLVVSNVDISNEGLFDVIVTDSVISTITPQVRLTVLVPPVYLVAPVNQMVASNTTFTASVVVRGNPPPFRYEWREISTVRSNITTTATTNFFISAPVINKLPTQTNSWRLLVYNDANTVGALAQFFVIALADTDQDGIPDIYDLDPNSNADRDVDTDGDGMSNYAEYIAGTDPTNPASYLKVDQITANGPASIQFTALSNHTYTVEYKDNPTGVWTRLSDVVAKNVNWTAIVTDPAPGTNRFYRLGTPKK